MYSLRMDRVGPPLNILYFKYFAATRNFYTHPSNVLAYFPACLCHFLCQATLSESSLIKCFSRPPSHDNGKSIKK